MLTQAEFENAMRAVLRDGGLKAPAYAVAAPVVWSETGPELLLEVRASGIPQAGDPCFPGGRIEAGETPAQAAAREMEEELGIRIDPARFLGQLPTVHTSLGRRTDVFVCALPREAAEELCVNPAEVEEVLRVPMSFFLENPAADSYPFGGHIIWGMTAGAVRHLCAAWRRAAVLEENGGR